MSRNKQPLFTPENQAKWVAGLNAGPVFIDGLSHHLFYLIVAAKNAADNYQAVVVGKFGSDSFKVKMYGSFEDWGFNASSLMDKFKAKSILSRKHGEGYERYMTDREGVRRIIGALSHTRNVTVAPIDGIWDAYDIPLSAREKTIKMLGHGRGASRPVIPFCPPELLTAE